MKILVRIFDILSSLKLAVVTILALAIALGTATFIESLYDTQTAQYWIYQAFWFHLILLSLGINIFCVAISRYPWKQRHIPFLLAHAGILILLVGSWLTQKKGIDGNLRVSEGESGSIVELDTASFVMTEKDKVYAARIDWIPPEVNFKPFDVSSRGIPYPIRIDQFLSHADPEVSFIPNTESSRASLPEKKAASALRVKLVGGPMGISQNLWLWEGAPSWQRIQAGPAILGLGPKAVGAPGQPVMNFRFEKNGDLSYEGISSARKTVSGRFSKDKVVGQKIQPGWKGNVTFFLEEVISDATIFTSYKPARVQHGPQAPTSAIHVSLSPEVQVWLGLGDRAVLHLDRQEVEIGYFPKRIILPFSVRLDRFTVEHDPGTLSPAAYSSRVTVFGKTGQSEALISMNEPLHQDGYTVYQASYEDGDPRPVTSIFAVNRDPGRTWKYLGSLLIVLGSILLFAAKYRVAKKTKKNQKLEVVEVV